MQIIQTPYYSLRAKTFNPDYLNLLQMEILSSPYLAESQLSNDFAGTRGFSIVFQGSEVNQVKEHFPYLQSYLDTVLLPTCNAFYLNPLIIRGGGRIKPHVDSSISGYCQPNTIPKFVSVLYIRVPSDMKGGELVLLKEGVIVGEIQPQANTLLYFQGHMKHSVNRVEASQDRISLVCEQYILNETLLQKIPKFKIESGVYREISPLE
ncbi:2OG-Fe(II) oxygenase [Nostoc sp. KVJ3]|uniref:2OG-Fe(II) oxygenase n=1 Tax=Nostoc sp. KVJ3 TaxID=457945 RepID=UPI0022373666|nr:2OG-Fe(II) oxygenase [Nostoc sp. KVJ3]MCW5315529.1 2OG-Fe(II) oxygenase [Nostoc sp. KVJ3]